MRRIIYTLLFVLVTGCFSSRAQSSDEVRFRYENQKIRTDSLVTLLGTLRAEYSKNSSISQRLLQVEKETYKARRDLEQLSKLLEAMTTTEDTRQLDAAIATQMLGDEDKKTIASFSSSEKEIARLVSRYTLSYGELKKLKNAYQIAETETDADSVYNVYQEVYRRKQEIEDKIYSIWQKLYDNKTYTYALVMEKLGMDSALQNMESLLNSSQQKIDEKKGKTDSEYITTYYYQKSTLLSIEKSIAPSVGLPQDSIALAQTSFSQLNILFDKIILEKRSFIEFEPIKKMALNYYSSKNPLPVTKEYMNGLLYRIQLGVYTTRPNVSVFKGVTPLSYSDKQYDGKYAYFVGCFATYEEAEDAQAYLKKLGFRSPKIVMWVDGQFVSNVEEWQQSNHTSSIRVSSVESLSEKIRSIAMQKGPSITISRSGNDVIISGFRSKMDAENVAAEILAADSTLRLKISDK